MVFPLLLSSGRLITRYAHIGILSNLGLVITLLFQIVIVHYARKIEYRVLMLLSISGIALFLGLITTASSFAGLLLLYLLLRASMSFYHPMGIAMVSRSHPDQGMDFAMGIQSGSGNLGVFLAFISAGYLSQHFGWRMPLLLWGAVCLTVGLICFFLVRGTRTRHLEPSKPDFKLWMQSMKRVKSWIPGFVFGGACWGTTVYYAPSLMNHRFGVPLGKTGLFLALWIALGTVMPYTFGPLARRFGRLNIATLGMGGATLFVLILGVSPSRALAIPALLVFGSFLFLIYPALQAIVGKLAPSREQTVVFSLVANIQMLSGALVNLLAGFLSDSFGIHTPFLFLAGLGTVVAVHFLLLRRSGTSSQAG